VVECANDRLLRRDVAPVWADNRGIAGGARPPQWPATEDGKTDILMEPRIYTWGSIKMVVEIGSTGNWNMIA